ELLALLVGQSYDVRIDAAGELDQHLGIDAIGLRQSARGLCKIAYLPWIDHRDTKTRCSNRAGRRRFVASASLHHHQTHLGRLQTRDKRANSLRLVWALLDRIDQTRDVQTCLRNINTDHHRLCLSHRASPSPNLAKMRASLGSRNRSGSSKRSGRTTPAPQRASKPWGWHGLPNRCCKSKASPLHVQIRHTRGGAKRRGGGVLGAAGPPLRDIVASCPPQRGGQGHKSFPLLVERGGAKR